MRKRSIALAFMAAALCGASFAPQEGAAQTPKQMAKMNADNTLGALGLNRGRVLLGDLRRLDTHDEEATVATAAFFGADELEQSVDGDSISAFHAGGVSGRTSMWMAGAYTDYESQYGVIGSDGEIVSLQLGADVQLSDNTLIGLMLFGDSLGAEVDNLIPNIGPIETDSEGFLAGPYVAIGLGDNIHLDALAAGGIVHNNYTWQGMSNIKYDSARLLLMARASGDWRTDDGWAIRPEARVSYYAEEREAFTDPMNNQFAEATNSIGQLRVGGEVSYDLVHNGYNVVRPFAGAEAVWSFHQDQLQMANQFVTPEELYGAFSLGLDVGLGDATVRAAGRYDGAAADDFDAVTGEMIVRFPLN